MLGVGLCDGVTNGWGPVQGVWGVRGGVGGGGGMEGVVSCPVGKIPRIPSPVRVSMSACLR